MIQCVGPAEAFCSRICCTQALKNALKLKELNPEARVTVIYRDIRAYGFKERLYTQAREQGVLFVRYDFDRKPQVALLISTGKLRTRELLSITPLYTYSDKPGVLPEKMADIISSFNKAVKEGSKQLFMENIKQLEELIDTQANFRTRLLRALRIEELTSHLNICTDNSFKEFHMIFSTVLPRTNFLLFIIFLQIYAHLFVGMVC